MARSRNRARPGLAWFLLALLGLLLALAARAAAADPCPATNLTDLDREDPELDDPEDEPDTEDPMIPDEIDPDLDADLPLLGVPDLASPGVAYAARARRSRWGHVDLTIAWRRTSYEPVHLMPHAADELWLLGTWSR